MRKGYPTRQNGRWRFTGACRVALNRNWKIYMLRGMFAIAQNYGFGHVCKAVHYELAELSAEPAAKRRR